MDKKMITEAFKQLLKRNLAGEIKKAQNSKAKPLTGNLAKLNKPVKIANVAIKMTEALVAMNAVDALATKMHQLLPRTTDGLEWMHALPSKIANSTIGQIPILGPIYRWINNAIAEGFAKLSEFLGNDALAAEVRKRKRVDPDEGFNASFDSEKHTLSGSKKENKQEGDESSMTNKNKNLTNAPSFYENLDLHKTFSIPGGYTKKTVVNGTLATPKLAVHRIVENPMPDKSATIDRVNQKYALIKAVRGLSATNYNIIDLYNYERFAKLNLLVYYTIKKVVQAAKTYSLVQTGISDNIITSLGFIPSEVRTNLANYETLLCQIHRFISNDLPISGTWIKRLEYLVGANIPDYSDQKVATIHQFAVSMSHVFISADKETTYTFDSIPNAGNNNYATLINNFMAYQTSLAANDTWQQLIADYFGAFGPQAMWSDKDYPAYKEPLNLRNADNDLCREQIKNAMYVNAKLEMITINEGVDNFKFVVDIDDAEPVQFTGYQFPNTFDNTAASSRRNLTYLNILEEDCYLEAYTGDIAATLGSTNKLLVPDHNGVGAHTFNVTANTDETWSMDNHETIYSLRKDAYSEGEALEISQFKCRSIALQWKVNDLTDHYYANYIIKSHEYAMLDTIIYVFGSNGTNIVEQTYRVCDEVISDDDLTSTESPVDFPDEIMCWALVDWMPLVHFTFFQFSSDNSEYYPRDIACWDIDAFGSLDDRAFATSINYSVYSLQAAGLVIGKKRIDNLGAVYKDKASKSA